jgi:methylated-DNA-[protein]-cysteine S-methyltransferase
MKTRQWKMSSPLGPLYLVASEADLQSVRWTASPVPCVESLTVPGREVEILAQAAHQLEEYFAGRRQAFDLPLGARGTEFQRNVWDQLWRIPYGKTRSYRDIAREIKNEKAVRAVGTANGANPLSIVVPCHRVIAADGTLGGYSGGLSIKTRLLKLEGYSIS